MYRGISTKEGENLSVYICHEVLMNVLSTMKVLLIVYEGHCFYMHFHYWRETATISFCVAIRAIRRFVRQRHYHLAF